MKVKTYDIGFLKKTFVKMPLDGVTSLTWPGHYIESYDFNISELNIISKLTQHLSTDRLEKVFFRENPRKKYLTSG